MLSSLILMSCFEGACKYLFSGFKKVNIALCSPKAHKKDLFLLDLIGNRYLPSSVKSDKQAKRAMKIISKATQYNITERLLSAVLVKKSVIDSQIKKLKAI